MLPSTRVFQVVSFRQVFPSKPCMHLSSPHPIRLTCSPPPISFFIIWSTEQWLVRCWISWISSEWRHSLTILRNSLTCVEPRHKPHYSPDSTGHKNVCHLFGTARQTSAKQARVAVTKTWRTFIQTVVILTDFNQILNGPTWSNSETSYQIL